MARTEGLIVLDTHAWIWMVAEPSELSERAQVAIDSAKSIAISSISIWEAALLAQRGRITPNVPFAGWAHAALHADRRLRQIPVDAAVSIRAVELRGDGLAGDPADQMILATAESLGAPLLTADRALREFAPDRTIW